ncbi:MAG: hypothetical protein AAGB24_14905, partial [Bacteroidota bacterium]
ILMALIWRLNIKSYRQLNSAKYEVLKDMEILLPYKFYTKEMEYLTEKTKSKFKHMTRIEQIAPILLCLLFLTLIIFSILKLLKI